MSMLTLLLRQQRLLQQACLTQTWWPAAAASRAPVMAQYCSIPESEDVGELEFFTEPPETQMRSGVLSPASSSSSSSSSHGFAPPAASTASHSQHSSSAGQLSKLHEAESAVLTLQEKVCASQGGQQRECLLHAIPPPAIK
jgi:hypothetical protein